MTRLTFFHKQGCSILTTGMIKKLQLRKVVYKFTASIVNENYFTFFALQRLKSYSAELLWLRIIPIVTLYSKAESNFVMLM